MVLFIQITNVSLHDGQHVNEDSWMWKGDHCRVLMIVHHLFDMSTASS